MSLVGLRHLPVLPVDMEPCIQATHKVVVQIARVLPRIVSSQAGFDDEITAMVLACTNTNLVHFEAQVVGNAPLPFGCRLEARMPRFNIMYLEFHFQQCPMHHHFQFPKTRRQWDLECGRQCLSQVDNLRWLGRGGQRFARQHVETRRYHTGKS